MDDTTERKRLAILRALRERDEPLPSHEIQRRLLDWGYEVSERTVRFHLQALDEEGLTVAIGRHGRRITPQGIQELSKARVFDKVGLFSARIDQMVYRMSFRLAEHRGTVLVNVSLLPKERVREACPLILRVFKSGYAMGRMMAVFDSGQLVGEVYVPEGFVGIGTVCSITLNGVLLKEGIPCVARFGGLLEFVNGKPSRIVGVINYDGTSLDPLEIFIKSGMTDYLEATWSGNGIIGVGYREIPGAARQAVLDIDRQLQEIGLGSVLEIGLPGQSLFGIPANEGSAGMVVIGGLNPIAILEESGIEISSRAMTGLIDYADLFPYEQLEERLRQVS